MSGKVLPKFRDVRIAVASQIFPMTYTMQIMHRFARISAIRTVIVYCYAYMILIIIVFFHKNLGIKYITNSNIRMPKRG